MKCAVMMYIYMIVQHQVTFSILFIAQAPFKSYINIINIMNRIVFHRVKSFSKSNFLSFSLSLFQSMVTGQLGPLGVRAQWPVGVVLKTGNARARTRLPSTWEKTVLVSRMIERTAIPTTVQVWGFFLLLQIKWSFEDLMRLKCLYSIHRCKCACYDTYKNYIQCTQS